MHEHCSARVGRVSTSLFAIDRKRIDLVAEMIDGPAGSTRREAQIRLDGGGLDVALQRARGNAELTGRFGGGDQGRLRHASHSKLLGAVSSPPRRFCRHISSKVATVGHIELQWAYAVYRRAMASCGRSARADAGARESPCR